VTYSEFLAECNARTIFKSVAIENDKIRAALAARACSVSVHDMLDKR